MESLSSKHRRGSNLPQVLQGKHKRHSLQERLQLDLKSSNHMNDTTNTGFSQVQKERHMLLN